MKVIFTDHARLRMKQRGVTVAAVRLALAKPLLRKPSHPPTEIVQVIDSKGTLEVVFTQRRNTFVVVTVYYL